MYILHTAATEQGIQKKGVKTHSSFASHSAEVLVGLVQALSLRNYSLLEAPLDLGIFVQAASPLCASHGHGGFQLDLGYEISFLQMKWGKMDPSSSIARDFIISVSPSPVGQRTLS